jgi:hypothetical protein
MSVQREGRELLSFHSRVSIKQKLKNIGPHCAAAVPALVMAIGDEHHFQDRYRVLVAYEYLYWLEHHGYGLCSCE